MINPRIDPSWLEVLRPQFEAPYFAQLKDFLVAERRQYVCYPKGGDIFAAFDRTPFDKVKVVILGQDPYHEPGQAHGLCFSVARGAIAECHIDGKGASGRFAPAQGLGTLYRCRHTGVGTAAHRHRVYAVGQFRHQQGAIYRPFAALCADGTSSVAVVGLQGFLRVQALLAVQRHIAAAGACTDRLDTNKLRKTPFSPTLHFFLFIHFFCVSLHRECGRSLRK